MKEGKSPESEERDAASDHLIAAAAELEPCSLDFHDERPNPLLRDAGPVRAAALLRVSKPCRRLGIVIIPTPDP